MIFEQITDKMALTPKKLFLLDSFGALLSAFLLGVVLVRLEYIFGIPAKVLYVLAFLPCIFVVYDVYCYLRSGENQKYFLIGIALMNLIYSFLSLGLLSSPLFKFSLKNVL